MGEGTNSPILAVLLACVVATLVLVVLGFRLRRTGRLASRRAALVWAIVCLLPVFGAGFVMFTRHTVDLATGRDKSGVDSSPVY